MKQETALDILKAGRNVFLTGAAGTGKTHVLNEYIKHLREHAVSVGVTASTGIAATHLGGMTIHSWSGIGIKDYLSEWDLDAMTQKQYLAKRFQRTKVLIIDEVSMLCPNIIDMVDQVCRVMKRQDDKPFGGMQAVFSGDFFQLPPIVRGGEDDLFADSAGAWAGADIRVCYLSEQYRQDDDSYAQLLNDIRDGNVSHNTYKKLNGRLNAKPTSDIDSTKLYTHNIDVDARNADELAKLKSSTVEFKMKTKGKKNIIESMKKSVLAPELLELKKGAIVIFVKNDRDGRYVNGTIGKVIGFEFGSPVVETTSGDKIVAEKVEWTIDEDGKVLATLEQVPLRLAWALTVHKSQGMSLDTAEIDLSKAFTPGQGYVALSRLRNLGGLILTGLNDKALVMHPYVVELDSRLRAQSHKWECVVSRFDENSMQKMHEDFILDSGGSLDTKKIKKEQVEERLTTYEKTYNLIAKAKTVKEIAKERCLTEETILAHFEKLLATRRLNLGVLDLEKFNKFSDEELEEIKKVFDELGKEKLAPVRAKLKYKYTYKDLRLGRLFV